MFWVFFAVFLFTHGVPNVSIYVNSLKTSISCAKSAVVLSDALHVFFVNHPIKLHTHTHRRTHIHTYLHGNIVIVKLTITKH